MKKLLLVALVAGGLTLVAAPRSDARTVSPRAYARARESLNLAELNSVSLC
jgi:hypothetical protein